MIICDRCERHFRASEDVCPFCNRSGNVVRVLNALGGAMGTVILAACYGVPDKPFTEPTAGTGGTGMMTSPTPTDTPTTGETGSTPDGDADGTPDGLDCDDADGTIHPGAAEICTDGKDNDCDGNIDAADSECP